MLEESPFGVGVGVGIIVFVSLMVFCLVSLSFGRQKERKEFGKLKKR